MAFTTLVSVSELAANLDNPEFVIFDCRHELGNAHYGTLAYSESHLPNARFAHVDRDLAGEPTGYNGRHPLPEIETFVRWLEKMGVSNDKQVIGYDDAGGVYASRLWWMLRWVGHDRVAALNGGWKAWTGADQPVTTKVPAPASGKFIAKPRAAGVDANYILSRLNSTQIAVLDARSNDRFHGKNETIDPVGGHIPGALNRFFKDNLDDQGYFKPAAQLRDEFRKVIGASPAERVVHQCGSGVSACHNLLAMEIAGLNGSRLYPGSWSEWIADPSRPIAT